MTGWMQVLEFLHASKGLCYDDHKLCGKGLNRGMWTVIYIAGSSKTAENIQTRLSAEGFLVKLRPTKTAKPQFEILVPETELDEVQELLKEIIHSTHR